MNSLKSRIPRPYLLTAFVLPLNWKEIVNQQARCSSTCQPYSGKDPIFKYRGRGTLLFLGSDMYPRQEGALAGNVDDRIFQQESVTNERRRVMGSLSIWHPVSHAEIIHRRSETLAAAWLSC